MTVDRRAVGVLLAVLGIEERELAELMGYRPGYVTNVLNGRTPVSRSFHDAFGKAIACMLVGPPPAQPERYPAGPLLVLIRRRAAQAPSKSQFYADLGVSVNSLSGRKVVSGALVDRVCCALGVHPTAVYGCDCGTEEAS
jgi:hypothetical protein